MLDIEVLGASPELGSQLSRNSHFKAAHGRPARISTDET
jgi:hypothetical protein